MASCTQEIDIPEPAEKEGKEEKAEKEGEIVIISATIPQEPRVAYDDGTLKLSWQTDDQLLLVGYDGDTYKGNSTFTYIAGSDGNFSGTTVPGATTYKAYYPGDIITLDDNGEVQLPANFWQQTQSGDNSTAHLGKKLLMSDVGANALNESFTLTLQSSIVRFNLNSIPSEVGTLQKVIWTLQTSAEGFTELAILNVTGVNSCTTSLTAFLAFDPAVMRIAENGEVKITLIGSQSSYEWSTNTTKTGGMTYETGKRYYATVNGVWTTLANPQFRFTIQTAEANQQYDILQKDASSTSPAELTINWGDGTANTTIAKSASLAKTIADHTYVSPGNYTITITSDQVDPTVKQMPQIVFYNIDNYTRDEQLTGILDPFPNMGATDFYCCFRECFKLSAIPADLFRYNTQTESFTGCFLYCVGLKSTIPADLFKFNTQAKHFFGCFQYCSGLTGTIQADLFKYNTQALSFAYCFNGCTGLNGTIPAELFKYNTQAVDFGGCFYGCSGLNGTIPTDLFKYNTQATHFKYCFSDCTGLNGTIPVELFKYNTQATNFEACFQGWTQLSTIPADLFRFNTQATSFSQCFSGCSGLNSIPPSLFQYNTQTTSFSACFSSCSGLSAIPADLFRDNTQATLFHSCFFGCTGLSAIPADLFWYNTQATHFQQCFEGCTGLNSLPVDLFRYNAQAEDFRFCFSRCTELSSLPADLFSYNTRAKYFYRCFYGCTKLQLRSDIFPDPETNPGFFEGRTMKFGECFKDVGTYYTTPTGTAPELWKFNGGGGTTGPTTWTITNCFTGANVVYRNFIPKSWGGDLADLGNVTNVDGEYW